MSSDPKKTDLTFDRLISSLQNVDQTLQAQAGRAVNLSLTLRNWLIGCYIAEYELNGADKAVYGNNLLSNLAERLKELCVSNCNHRQIYDYLKFYRTYSRILPTLSAKLQLLLPEGVADNSEMTKNLSKESVVPSEQLLNSLSYSKLKLLVNLDDETQRAFYEFECIRSNWSVRELKRQIASLYYERSGLSKDKKKLTKMMQANAEQSEPTLSIRDPYIFEFLGIKSRDAMSESDLEDALLNKLNDFLLEMGHGFCFEARQKRILIGDTYGFIDLVFYHRILKCHVLVELKIEEFSHENIGQLNTYVSWYRKNIMREGDNPPVGILLCTQKDHALAEYALAGIDNQLFVSKYKLELPDPEEMQRFLEREIAESDMLEDDSKTGMLVREMRAKYRTRTGK